MQTLISFLTDHFFIVVVVIGLIYSMFFRKSPLEKPPGERRPASRPNRMPDFGGSPVFPPPKPRQTGAPPGSQPAERKGPPPLFRREPRPEYSQPRSEADQTRPVFSMPRPESPQPRPVMSVPKQTVYRNPLPERVEEDKPMPESAPLTSRLPVAETPAASPSIVASTGADDESLRNPLTSDDLTRAILWAEILGPPRARRPFRR